jgi:hypothetical protein
MILRALIGGCQLVILALQLGFWFVPIDARVPACFRPWWPVLKITVA